MRPKDIMKLPYIFFVIGMLDAPQIDYNAKKKSKVNKPTTAEEEIAIIAGALG